MADVLRATAAMRIPGGVWHAWVMPLLVMERSGSLRDREWPTILMTSGNDLIQDLFVPALRCAETYCRGVESYLRSTHAGGRRYMVNCAARKSVSRWSYPNRSAGSSRYTSRA